MSKRKLPNLSESEWRVMEVLWLRSPLTANDVIDSLARATKWSGNTVRTLLTRLVRKGALETEKEGLRFLYSPTFNREAYVAAESDSFLKRVFLGSAKPLLLHFAERTKLSDDDIKELKNCLTKGKDVK